MSNSGWEEESGGEEEEEEVAQDDGDDASSEESNNSSSAIRKKRSAPPERSAAASRGLKKHKNATRGRKFMDFEAAVGDDEDEDFDEEDEDFLGEADEAQVVERDLSHRRRMDWQDDRQRERPGGGASHLASAIGTLEMRYQDQQYDMMEEEDAPEYEYETKDDDVMRLMADIRNAKLWIIPVLKGVSERELVTSIMNKYLILKQKGESFPLLSAFAPEVLKGHIYVEAENMAHVNIALRGLKGLQLRNTKMVPVKEMSRVFTMGDRAINCVARGQFVRIKGGIYQGDLAQVTETEDQLFVHVRLVPRLNLEDKSNKSPSANNNNLKPPPSSKATRPLPMIRCREDLETKGFETEEGSARNTFRCMGKVFEDTGYLIRRVPIKSLIIGDVVCPSVNELREFTRKEVDLGIPRTSNFVAEDTVVIRNGELSGIKAKVVKVEKTSVWLIPEGLTKQIMVTRNDIMKYFEVGDNVRASQGTCVGSSGLITAVDYGKGTATIFSPELGGTSVVALEDLQFNNSKNTASMLSYGGYSVGDMVQMSNQTTGIITKIDVSKIYAILNTENVVENVPLSMIASKRNNDLAVMLDSRGTPFGVKALVLLLDNKEKQGRVIHLWQQKVFIKLFSQDVTNSGYVVSRSRDLQVLRGEGTTFQQSEQQQLMNHEGAGGRGNFNRGRGGGGGRGNRGGKLVNKRVKMIAGRNKGYVGVIESADGDRFRVRLSHNAQSVPSTSKDFVLLESHRGGHQQQQHRGMNEWNTYLNDVKETKEQGTSAGASSSW